LIVSFLHEKSNIFKCFLAFFRFGKIKLNVDLAMVNRLEIIYGDLFLIDKTQISKTGKIFSFGYLKVSILKKIYFE